MDKKNKIRKVIQYLLLAISIAAVLLIVRSQNAVAHEYCPYSVVCFGVFNLLNKTSDFVLPISLILFGIITLLSLVIGRLFCGYICPIGTLQEKIYKLNSKENYFKEIMPIKIHSFLKYLQYIILIITVILIVMGKQILYMDFCPVLGICHPQNYFFWGGVTFLISLLISFFISRFWCRYLCPYAALMNIVQGLGKILRLKKKVIIRNIDTSMNCKNCIDFCPMLIDIKNKNRIEDFNCIHCRCCVRICKKSDRSKENCRYNCKM